MTGPATLDDVYECYRQILAREPETEAIAASHLHDAPTLWQLVRRFLAVDEGMAPKVHDAAGFIRREQDGRAVDLTMTDGQRAALMAHVEAVWRRYGRTDPYYSVLTNPRYHAGTITAAGIEEFYATGRAELADIVDYLERSGVVIDPRWSVVELGCGVARVGAAFVDRFDDYLGIDISADHLALARRHLDAHADGRGAVMLLRDFTAGESRHDLFYSRIVLQHNPPPIIEYLLDVCLARLRPGGYAWFQLPCHLYGYRFDVRSYLDGVGRKQEMEMHALPQHAVFAALARHGMTLIAVVPDASIGPIGFSYTFLARKDAA